MKLFATLALAGLASALELEQNYMFAQQDVTHEGQVTHPDSDDGTNPTILDRDNSTKKIGRLSYQIFFDNVVADVTHGDCGADFVEGKHICCYKHQIDQPFLATTTTERFATYTTQNCPSISGYSFVDDFTRLSFALGGGVETSEEDRAYDLTNWARKDDIIYAGGAYNFIIDNGSEDVSAIFWSIGTFDRDGDSWTSVVTLEGGL